MSKTAFDTKPTIKAKPERPTFSPYCNVHGCRNPGALSRGTLGAGPWYCRAHIWNQGYPEADPKPKDGVKVLGEYLTAMTGRR